jgi:hypothetical protein
MAPGRPKQGLLASATHPLIAETAGIGSPPVSSPMVVLMVGSSGLLDIDRDDNMALRGTEGEKAHAALMITERIVSFISK